VREVEAEFGVYMVVIGTSVGRAVTVKFELKVERVAGDWTATEGSMSFVVGAAVGWEVIPS
jgi:hypothetical protein